MIIQLKQNTNLRKESQFKRLLFNLHVKTIEVDRDNHKLYVSVGRFGSNARRKIESHPLVDRIIKADKPYKLASRNFKLLKSKIKVNGTEIGGKKIVLMAGPCSVETKDQIRETAEGVSKAGCQILRGGAFKPRTGPYSFQGLGKIGLHFLKQAAKENKLGIITEIMDVRDIELLEKYTDVFQVGTRNMQNYPLLKELGKSKKPVLLKRGMWATYKEFLLAAEYILLGGNDKVILCERGIRTHVTETRFTLDLNIIPYLKQETHLPVFVDPSHGTGKRSLVRAMSRASIAAGADGLLIEAHLDPRRSISDADQAISIVELEKIVRDVKKIAEAVGREI